MHWFTAVSTSALCLKFLHAIQVYVCTKFVSLNRICLPAGQESEARNMKGVIAGNQASEDAQLVLSASAAVNFSQPHSEVYILSG